jgi:AAA domain-containing protein
VKHGDEVSHVLGGARDWIAKPGIGYDMLIPDIGVYFSLSRIRRDKSETIGLLTVRVTFRGARNVFNGLLSSADFNCSSLRARNERAKHLRERGRADDIDWSGLLEEFCIRVLESEEEGEPEMALEKVPYNEANNVELVAGGMPLLRRLPSIWFGDGGAAKSYLALYAAIDLAQHGENVLYCDWEFSGEEHRHRLHRLVGSYPGLENLLYRRCDRPLSRDVVRLRDIVIKRKISFLICDSIGFAADSTPEGAEAATNYFRALRELGPIGSLHLAHISKAEQGDQKPFGSVFWSNGARNIWYLKRDDKTRDKEIVPIGFFHRKSNIGPLRPDFAMVAKFQGKQTAIFPDEITNYPTLCEKMGVADRLIAEIKETGHPMSKDEIEEALGIEGDKTGKLRHALKRGVDRNELVKTPDGRYMLPERPN